MISASYKLTVIELALGQSTVLGPFHIAGAPVVANGRYCSITILRCLCVSLHHHHSLRHYLVTGSCWLWPSVYCPSLSFHWGLGICPSTSHSHNHTLTHSHTLLITCTCRYDQIKGTQDKDFSYSFSDSPSVSMLQQYRTSGTESPRSRAYVHAWQSDGL